MSSFNLWRLSTTFETSTNVSYNTILFTFVAIGDNTCTTIYLQNTLFKIQTIRHTCNSLMKLTIINSPLMYKGQELQKLPTYTIMLHGINIWMLHLTFEGWNIQRFIRIQYICLCTNIHIMNIRGHDMWYKNNWRYTLLINSYVCSSSYVHTI